MKVKISQKSTQRGLILVIGAIVSLAFEWFGHSSAQVAPIITVLLAGLHGAMTDDDSNK